MGKASDRYPAANRPGDDNVRGSHAHRFAEGGYDIRPCLRRLLLPLAGAALRGGDNVPGVERVTTHAVPLKVPPLGVLTA